LLGIDDAPRIRDPNCTDDSSGSDEDSTDEDDLVKRFD
jgi:hypothetical protein